MEAIKADNNMTINILEFIAEQKKKINPSYVNTLGTESFERDIWVKIVEQLLPLLQESKERVKELSVELHKWEEMAEFNGLRLKADTCGQDVRGLRSRHESLMAELKEIGANCDDTTTVNSAGTLYSNYWVAYSAVQSVIDKYDTKDGVKE